jgi:hypothetical protein
MAAPAYSSPAELEMPRSPTKIETRGALKPNRSAAARPAPIPGESRKGNVRELAIADKAAGKNLAPARDTAERYKLLEWLNYITTELHKNLGPMFSPVLADDAKAFFKDRAMGKFKYLETQLAGRDYLMGKQFTVANGYLFTMLMWATDRLNFDLSGLPNLMAYKARVAARPKVQEAMESDKVLDVARFPRITFEQQQSNGLIQNILCRDPSGAHIVQKLQGIVIHHHRTPDQNILLGAL